MSKTKTIYSRILIPLLIFFFFFAIYVFWPDVIVWTRISQLRMGQSLIFLKYLIGVMIWLSFAWGLVRVIDILFWELFIERRLKKVVPKLLKQLIYILVFFIAILGIVGVLFEKSVTGLLTASGVVGLIVGLSIKNLMADIFNGVAMNLDRPFRIGDYIYLHDFNLNEPVKVLEVNWRATRLERLNSQLLIISNQKLSTMPITNLSRNPFSKEKLLITIDQTIPNKRVANIFTAGALSIEGVMAEPAPLVQMNSFADTGIVYNLSFWINKNKCDPFMVKEKVFLAIAEQLQLAGIQQIIPKTIMQHENLQTKQYESISEPKAILQKIDIFKSLSQESFSLLEQHIKTKLVREDEFIVRQGESGDSMFVLAEGLLKVFISSKEKSELIEVGNITSGQFFGEMSLLTGERRSASVKAVTESLLITIPKKAMSCLFEKDPQLIERISTVITKYQEKNLRLETEWYGKNKKEEERLKFRQNLFIKIKKFFGINY